MVLLFISFPTDTFKYMFECEQDIAKNRINIKQKST